MESETTNVLGFVSVNGRERGQAQFQPKPNVLGTVDETEDSTKPYKAVCDVTLHQVPWRNRLETTWRSAVYREQQRNTKEKI